MKLKFCLSVGIIACAFHLGLYPATAYATESTQLAELNDNEEATSDISNEESSDTTAAEDENVLDSCTINVLVKIKYISLNEQVLLLKEGEEKQLEATVMPEDAYDTTIYRFESSDEQVVSVTEDGLVTALSEGCATVTAYGADDTSRECSVVVYKNGDLSSISEEQSNWTYKMFYSALADLKSYSCPWDKIICIGDSVTEGVQGGASKSEWVPNYPLTMEYILNTEVINAGIGGAGVWSRGNISLLDQTDKYVDADAVFVMTGYNDWFYGTQCPMGDTETEHTFTYDLNVFYDKIKELYPDSDIFVVLPPTPHSHMGYEPYYDISWIRGVEHELADAHNFYVINLPAEDILNGAEDETWQTFFSDGVHLNDYGYTVLGTIIADKALEIKYGN